MSKINNWMMSIEDFCNGYFSGFQIRIMQEQAENGAEKSDLDPLSPFTIDEIVEDAGWYFKSVEAKKYAEKYLKETLSNGVTI